MSAGYNARRAPNVSQYIADLNTIPSAADAASQQDFGAFNEDLDLFSNTQFFDFDMNETVPRLSGDMAFTAEAPQGQIANQPEFQFPDFSFPQSQPQPRRLLSQSLPPSPPNGLAQYPAPLAPQQDSFAPSPGLGEKRKFTAASLSSPGDYEEHGRVAADEDKRRRNTAASARFRVKKKQREQALEKSAKDMSDKVHFLEARVGQLEMENKWLKSLITEKNLKGIEVPAAQNGSEQTDDDRSTELRTDGVGTEVDKATA